MDCLRSFVIGIDLSGTFSGGGVVKNWTVGTEVYWAIRQVGSSTFKFQGYKNVEIYGVDVVGGIQTQVGAAIGGVLVTDWNFEIFIDGQLPLVSGNIDTSLPNFWLPSVNTNQTKVFALSKNSNSLRFKDPIKSPSVIEFQVLNAQGTGAQSALPALDIDLSFIVYYKYEGE